MPSLRRAPLVGHRRVALSVEVTLVRHGETTANVAGIWQGWTNAGFSAGGREQVKRLAARLQTNPYDVVVSSDLGRAMATAGALGVDVESDARWREMNLGDWEGKTRDEVRDMDSDVAAALDERQDIAFGGGERMSELVGRAEEALYDLAGRLDDGQRALVVSHGGTIFSLTSSLLGDVGRGRILRLTNTSLTTWRLGDGDPQLVVFNDSAHLPGTPVRSPADTSHVYLIRHGETEANVSRRWQGQQDGVLTAKGREQARRLSLITPDVDALYTSPLGRARDTAVILAATNGHVIETVDGVKEIGFGTWENRTRAEIARIDPAGLRSIDQGVDVRRGGYGETYDEVCRRMSDSVTRLAARHAGRAVSIVSHGGAIRALGTHVLGIDFADRSRLAVPANTAMSRFVYGERGSALASWNVAPHLERTEAG